MASFSGTERAALASLLDDVGPDAPTLCEGWSTRDLAAHLVARERRPDTGPGLLLPWLAGWTERIRQGLATEPYGELVARVRAGPPGWNPLSWPVIEPAVNTVEFFIHHEDVRRAQPGWEPRPLPVGLETLLWGRIRGGARLMLRRAPVSVRLLAPGHGEVPVRSGEPTVTVTGPPAELLLFCSGRQRATRVEVTGALAARTALTTARLGV